jgi:hypothetical protein
VLVLSRSLLDPSKDKRKAGSRLVDSALRFLGGIEKNQNGKAHISFGHTSDHRFIPRRVLGPL